MRKFQRRSFVPPVFLKATAVKSVGYCFLESSFHSDNSQAQVLKEEGCSLVFEELPTFLDTADRRIQLNEALKSLNAGDQLVIPNLTCLASSQVRAINLISELLEKRVDLRTLDGLIHTRDLGELAPAMIGFMLSFLRLESINSLKKETSVVSIPLGNRRNPGGRPKTNKSKELLVIRLRSEGCSYRSIREQTGISLSTIRRILVEDELTLKPNFSKIH